MTEAQAEAQATAQAKAKSQLKAIVTRSAGNLSKSLKVLEEYGRDQAVEAIRQTWDDKTRRGTVVVVGEVKRGKSSLLNAIAGQRDLLPTDVDICTSTPLRMVAFDEGNDTIDLHFGDRVEKAPITELREWSTVGGARVADPDTVELPTSVTIRARGSHVPKAEFIDTPGAGGLDRDAIDIALSRARGAGVLLMVCDSSTPITSPEMDILNLASEGTGSVIVAVTKTDKNLRRWRAIVEDDKRLIREHLGRDVPVIGVSSLRAVDAAESTDPERRARIEATCGIAALRRQIEAELARGALLPKIAALSMAEGALKDVNTTLDADISAIDRPAEVLPELEQRKEELKKLQAHGQEWEQILGRNIAVTRQRIMGDFDAEVDKIREHWIRHINNSGMKVLRSKPQVFTAQIEAELNAAGERAVGKQLHMMRKESAALFGDVHEWHDMQHVALSRLAPADIGEREVASKRENLMDPGMITLGVISGPALASGGSAALGAIGVASVALPAAVIGVGWLGINMAYRAMRNGKQHLVTWVRETTVAMRQNVNRNVDTMVTTLRTEMVLRYRARLRAEMDIVKTRIEEAQKAARQDEQERRQKLAELRRRADIVGQMHKAVASDVTALRGVR